MEIELSESEQEFEKLESTKRGRRAERIVRDYFKFILGWKVVQDIRPGYDTSKDMNVRKNGLSYDIEIKLDGYEIETGNLPFEYQQTNKQGVLVDSFILTSTARYAAIYCQRRDTIYMVCLNVIRGYISSKSIKSFKSTECNELSETGSTLCYLISISFLEEDGVIVKSYSKALKTLEEQGFTY